jgi:hypothetical protein
LGDAAQIAVRPLVSEKDLVDFGRKAAQTGFDGLAFSWV